MVSAADASPVGAAWAAAHHPTAAAKTMIPVTAVRMANLFMLLDRAGGYEHGCPVTIGRGHRRNSDPVRDRRGALGELAASPAAAGSACWTPGHPMRKRLRANRNGHSLRRARSRSLVTPGACR